MRIALLLPVLFSLAAPAYAEGVRESRYGPTTPRQSAAPANAGPGVGPVAVATPYTGPMLSWASKQQPSNAVPIPASTAPARPAPVASWAGYAPQRSAATASTPTNPYAAPRPLPAATVPAPAQAQPRDWSNYRSPRAPAAAPPQPAATAPALPTNLYAAPRPAPVPIAAATQAQAPAKDWSNYRSSRMANAAPVSAPAPAPPPPPQAPTPPPPQPRQVAAVSPGTPGAIGARFYSVTRDAGLTPDPIPPAGPDHQVLITGDAPTLPPSDAAPMHGSADWLAAGVAGDDNDQDDSSARRRAQTRNEAL